jgi:pyruvate dehydrogenase E2 component (dihydrolipoamide acetyltransferase)
MATTVEMPQLGNTVEECLITRWVKRPGDAVSAGEVVAEIETDKTTFEVTAPVDGVVLETFGEEGGLVPVFTKLFVIGGAGETLKTQATEMVSPDLASAGSAPISAIDSQWSSALPKAEVREPMAAGHSRRAAVSPRALAFASARGLNPRSIAGTGPGGRVLERDVRRAHESTRPTNTRQTIARRMRDSLASTAQYTLNASARANGLLALRARCKASAELEGITINDLVAFCTIKALMEASDLNAEFVDGQIVRHAEIHLGFACDTPKGLMAPVVRDAHQLPVLALSKQMKALTAQAVEGTINPRDLSGATFTISNLGHLGIESFTPVLNPPQVGILGVGNIQLKPIRTQGRVDFIDSIGFSLTCDHQVIDGAPGARFLLTLKEKIETVESQSLI